MSAPARIEGKRNQTRILSIIREHPLTFKELHEKAGLSKPVVSDHLKALRERGLIERTIKNNQIVYQVVSEEKVRNEVKADLFDLITYIFSPLIPEETINKFTKDLVKMTLEQGKEKAYEEKIFKPLKKVTEEPTKKKVAAIAEFEFEETITVPESKIKKLSKKYPEAMKELLEEAKD